MRVCFTYFSLKLKYTSCDFALQAQLPWSRETVALLGLTVDFRALVVLYTLCLIWYNALQTIEFCNNLSYLVDH